MKILILSKTETETVSPANLKESFGSLQKKPILLRGIFPNSINPISAITVNANSTSIRSTQRNVFLQTLMILGIVWPLTGLPVLSVVPSSNEIVLQRVSCSVDLCITLAPVFVIYNLSMSNKENNLFSFTFEAELQLLMVVSNHQLGRPCKSKPNQAESSRVVKARETETTKFDLSDEKWKESEHEMGRVIRNVNHFFSLH